MSTIDYYNELLNKHGTTLDNPGFRAMLQPYEGMEELSLPSTVKFRFVKNEEKPEDNKLLLEVPGSTQSYNVDENGYFKAMRLASFPEAVIKKYPKEMMIEPLNWGFNYNLGDSIKAFVKSNYLVAFVKPSLELVSTQSLVDSAAKICGPETLVERLDHDLSYTNCSMLIPNRHREWDDDRIDKAAQRGDIVVGGINFHNSIMGESPLELSGYVYRLVCSNGMVSAESRFKWSRKNEATPLTEWFEDKLAACVDGIEHEFEKIGQLVEKRIPDGHRSDVLANVFKTYELSEKMRSMVLEKLTDNPPRHMWDVLNAITNLANNEEYLANPHTIRRLQVIGGDIATKAHVCETCFSVRRS